MPSGWAWLRQSNALADVVGGGCCNADIAALPTPGSRARYSGVGGNTARTHFVVSGTLSGTVVIR